jgi:hypothetical protein
VLFLLAIPFIAAAADDVAERNKADARRYLEQGWFQGKPEAVKTLMAERVRVHDPRSSDASEETSGRQLQTLVNWCNLNGDCQGSEILFQIAEGDKVLTYWIFRQTPKRLLGGLVQRIFGRVPAERRMATVFRFEEGLITEVWGMRDDLGLYSDLGLLNVSILSVFALGGAAGLFLMWILWRMTRQGAMVR